ncbi:MAG: helix-turn-helix domain-containing protein [Acidimicrobiales bacterium]
MTIAPEGERPTAELVRRSRQRAGLSQSELARRSGVARTLINRYENGHLSPSIFSLARLLAACGETAFPIEEVAGAKLRASRASKYEPHHELVDSIRVAKLIKSVHSEPGGQQMAFGAVRMWVHEFRCAPRWARLQIIEAEPDHIDPRWDAVLAGTAEYLTLGEGTPVPAWAMEPDRFLDHAWFPIGLPSIRAMALRDAEISMKVRGVFVHAESLESV